MLGSTLLGAMSLVASLLAPRAAITTSYELDQFLRAGGLETDSGAIVSPESAMRVAAVYSCVRILAEGVAQLPLHVYRRLERGKERASDHWAYHLLHDRPNPWQTSFEFREMMQAHLALSGNAYALKTVVRGEVRELLPVIPDRVEVKHLPDYRLVYEVTMPDGRPLPVPAERMFHLRGLSFNGFKGLSPVAYQREVIGVAMQLMRHEARFYKQGASVGGVLEHPAKLSPDAAKRLQESFDEKYSGAGNAHKTLLLEEGMKFSKTGLSARDAQFIESMKFSEAQIASIFRVPVHMVNNLDRSTHSNIEHEGQAFVTYTLGSWLARWEQRITRSVIPEAEQDKVFAEFLVDGLLRGDFSTRMSGYQTAIQTGILSPNEVREKENLNPREGGDEYVKPAFLTGKQSGATEPDPPPAKRKPPTPDEGEEEDEDV